MQFFTATILEWKKLLQPDQYKQLITDSLGWMVREKRAFIYGFVIMPSHIHLLWDARDGFTQSQNELALLRYSAHEIEKDLVKNHPDVLSHFKSTQADRKYHFWERRPYASDIPNRTVAAQKLEYIHYNPLSKKWKLVTRPEDYYYSSARYYLLNIDDFGFITHYMEHITGW